MGTTIMSLRVSLGAISHACIDPRLLLSPKGVTCGIGRQIRSLGSLGYAGKAIQQFQEEQN